MVVFFYMIYVRFCWIIVPASNSEVSSWECLIQLLAFDLFGVYDFFGLYHIAYGMDFDWFLMMLHGLIYLVYHIFDEMDFDFF